MHISLSLLVFTNALRPWNLHVRTVLSILVWVAVAMLILNIYLRSELVFLTSIALVAIAVVIYFIPIVRVHVHQVAKWAGQDSDCDLCRLSSADL